MSEPRSPTLSWPGWFPHRGSWRIAVVARPHDLAKDRFGFLIRQTGDGRQRERPGLFAEKEVLGHFLSNVQVTVHIR
jgi:hypothetical protein